MHSTVYFSEGSGEMKMDKVDYDKGYAYLCSTGNYIETRDGLLQKLKRAGVKDPEGVVKKLMEESEIVQGKKKDSYVLKFNKCRAKEEDIISE
jgi:hypothetical protein